MRHVLHLVLLGAAALVPTVASADSIEVRAGALFPFTGKSNAEDCAPGCNLFADLQELFGATKDGWIGGTGGIEFSRRLAPTVELALHVDGYARRRETRYVSSEVPPDLRQTMEYSFVPIGLSARLLPAGGRGRLTPYVAAGVDVVVWQFKEHGDYFDFGSQDPFYEHYSASGATSGLHVAAGLRMPLSYDLALTSEVRYLWTSKVTVGDDYLNDEGQGVYEIQPGGLSATLGLNLRF